MTGPYQQAAHRGPSEELQRLRKRVNQQEHSLAVLAQAVSVLRSGSMALRDENRELRLQLQGRRPGATPDRSAPRALDRQHDTAALAASEPELRRQAELVRHEPRSPRRRAA